MEEVVDDQGVVVVSQGKSAGNGNLEVSDSNSSTTQVVTTATGQTIAVPTGGGSVSIVHMALPNQVQSVIQQNQQSVIQSTPGAGSTVQTIQVKTDDGHHHTAHANILEMLSKGNVILLNKGTGSVIHTVAGTGTPIQTLQVATVGDSEDSIPSAEDESKKRRELLARRPSYRKILNELSSAETTDGKDDASTDASSQEASEAANTITVSGVTGNLTGFAHGENFAVVPAGSIQIATGSQAEGIQGLQTLTMTNAGAGTAGTIVQYAQGQDGQFFVPVTVSAADIQAYQIRTPSASAASLPQGVVMTTTGNIQSPQQVAEEASRKREFRLMKNREAAKECRRKKKDYIKCLENRVSVLENQNKALIDELKSLKELYCQKAE